jgi:nickel transport protein
LKVRFLVPLLIAIGWGWADKAQAHGASIETSKTQAVQIEAAYDSGQPMAEAQVTVYSPENPAEPWKTAATDSEGQYVFVPDQTGQWQVQVRQAGHGDIATVMVDQVENSSNAESENDSALNPEADDSGMQKLLYGAAGAWGFLGTALFFVRRWQTD